jgi:carbon-monoxide dehydrogenase iron sulfur subunit
MPPKLVVQPEKCTGCKSCMLICSFAHIDAFSYDDARLKVAKNESRGQSIPQVCRNCEDPPCIPACPVEAIRRDPGNQWVILDEGACTGCAACTDACPYQAIHMHPTSGIAIKCDFCGGDPQCVKVCRLPEALVWG